jgi:hypothetical protein
MGALGFRPGWQGDDNGASLNAEIDCAEMPFSRPEPGHQLLADSVEKLCLSPFISTDSILVLRGD